MSDNVGIGSVWADSQIRAWESSWRPIEVISKAALIVMVLFGLIAISIEAYCAWIPTEHCKFAVLVPYFHHQGISFYLLLITLLLIITVIAFLGVLSPSDVPDEIQVAYRSKELRRLMLLCKIRNSGRIFRRIFIEPVLWVLICSLILYIYNNSSYNQLLLITRSLYVLCIGSFLAFLTLSLVAMALKRMNYLSRLIIVIAPMTMVVIGSLISFTTLVIIEITLIGVGTAMLVICLLTLRKIRNEARDTLGW